MTLDTWLKQQGLLQKAFAKKLGVSTATISMIRSGKRLPSPSLARDIEQFTNKRVKMSDWDWPVRLAAE